MNTFVTAVVVSHEADDYLAVTQKALDSQLRQPDHILVIEPSNFASVSEAIQTSLPSDLPENSWIWLLHDDTAPDPSALAELVSAIELSPSVALAGPKLVRWQQPRVITQLGLTLTRGGSPFSPIDEQFDQGQHDDIDDVMAVGSAAALIRLDVFQQLGGFDQNAPFQATDLDFSIRVRLAGHRVIVVPSARVQHGELSALGKRKRSWLGSSVRAALRRGEIHLRLAYAPMIWALLFWLFLPLIGILRAILQVARKRPELIWVEIASAVWGFFTIGRRLSSRSNIASNRKLPLRELHALRASRAEVRLQRRADQEREESLDNLNAFERGEGDLLTGKASLGFFATGGVWWMLALAAISFEFWPRDVAVTAKGVIPLSATWWDVFMRAGASYQPIGLGFFAPSDPFAWVLTGLSGLTFWAPSLSLAILIFLVKPLAFIGGWKLVAQLTTTTWIRVLAGLGFAFWPALQVAQNDGRISALISGLAAPWLVIALLRVAQIGRITKSSAQSWTWVATAGLLVAIIGASTPNLIPVILAALIFIALIRIRRLGYLIWVGLPLVAIFGPTALYYLVGLAHPLAILADPGLAVASPRAPFLDFYGLVASGLVALVALFALLRKRVLLAITGWLLILVALVLAYLVASLNFPAVGVGQANLETVNGSPAALLIIVGMALIGLVALAIDGIPAKNARRTIAAITLVLVLLPGMALATTTTPRLQYSDGRVVPSIVAAEAEQGSRLSLLVLTPSTDASGNKRLAAEMVAGDGVHLDDLSLAYRFSISSLAKQKYADVAQLVADLVSANGTPISKRLQKQHIGYVLVPSGASADISNLAIALDSVSELETVGVTDFGRLWRVRAPEQPSAMDPSSPWSVTKAVQVAILVGFVLMAVPSRSTRRRTTEEIFIESGEDAQ
ncbi:MAG: glycosyltransferase family 2 protein [Rhodoluna sp.]